MSMGLAVAPALSEMLCCTNCTNMCTCFVLGCVGPSSDAMVNYNYTKCARHRLGSTELHFVCIDRRQDEGFCFHVVAQQEELEESQRILYFAWTQIVDTYIHSYMRTILNRLENTHIESSNVPMYSSNLSVHLEILIVLTYPNLLQCGRFQAVACGARISAPVVRDPQTRFPQ